MIPSGILLGIPLRTSAINPLEIRAKILPENSPVILPEISLAIPLDLEISLWAPPRILSNNLSKDFNRNYFKKSI